MNTNRAIARNSGPCALNLLWGPLKIKCVCVCGGLGDGITLFSIIILVMGLQLE